MSLVCQSSLCTQHEWEPVWTCGLQGGYFSRLWAAENRWRSDCLKRAARRNDKAAIMGDGLEMDVKSVWIEKKLKSCTCYLVFKCWGKCQGYEEGQNNRKWNLTHWDTPLLFKSMQLNKHICMDHFCTSSGRMGKATKGKWEKWTSDSLI